MKHVVLIDGDECNLVANTMPRDYTACQSTI